MLPGDFNNNGVVDAADYVVWRKGLGTTYIASDFNTWRSHFGNRASGTAAGTGTMEESGAVPEPRTAILLCTVGVVLACGLRS